MPAVRVRAVRKGKSKELRTFAFCLLPFAFRPLTFTLAQRETEQPCIRAAPLTQKSVCLILTN
jgi:hypothetical protein